jgi:hypothetical protein
MLRPLILGLVLVAASCATIKPYEKEYLLSPVMDDASLARLAPKSVAPVQGSFERLAGSGGTQGTACPTCGG